MKLTKNSCSLSLLGLLLVRPAVTNSVIETDVVIVGGGISGLTSAYTLHHAGVNNTVVLEAKETIGGRCRSVQRQSGPGIIELGATWINNVTQPDVFALAEGFGLDMAEQYIGIKDGEQVQADLIHEGLTGNKERVPQDWVVNTKDPEQALLVGGLYELLEQSAAQVDLRDFQAFPKEQDRTVAEWVALNETLGQSAHVNATMSSLTAQLVGREAHEVGAHYLLDYIKSGGSLEELGGEDNKGAQYLKVKQGTSAIVQGLADTLEPGSVHVNTAVEAITRCNDHVIVTATTGQLFKTKKVILANPTNTYADIHFDPALPAEKESLVSRTKPGVYAKLILNYPEPWWRDAGLIGEFISLIGPVCFSWDTSDLSLEQYSLAIFVAGDAAARWHELSDEAAKKDAVVEHLAEIVGPKLEDKARDVLEINLAEWTLEDYLDGGPTSSMGPGLLRKYGAALREPFGDLHFGGGETAYEWKGYLEGAVRAGRRVAMEVVEKLKDECD